MSHSCLTVQQTRAHLQNVNDGLLADAALWLRQGAALIALPQFKLPLVAATGALHIHKALRRRRDQKQDALVLPGDADPSQARGAVTLEWDQLDCFIVKKDASEKQILHSVAGVARPGRWALLMS